MSVKKVVDLAMSREMSRRDFLGQVGALLLAVVGVSSILKSLGMHEGITHTITHGGGSSSNSKDAVTGTEPSGYGSSAYGR
jgi:hypothetical protein